MTSPSSSNTPVEVEQFFSAKEWDGIIAFVRIPEGTTACPHCGASWVHTHDEKGDPRPNYLTPRLVRAIERLERAQKNQDWLGEPAAGVINAFRESPNV